MSELFRQKLPSQVYWFPVHFRQLTTYIVKQLFDRMSYPLSAMLAARNPGWIIGFLQRREEKVSRLQSWMAMLCPLGVRHFILKILNREQPNY